MMNLFGRSVSLCSCTANGHSKKKLTFVHHDGSRHNATIMTLPGMKDFPAHLTNFPTLRGVAIHCPDCGITTNLQKAPHYTGDE